MSKNTKHFVAGVAVGFFACWLYRRSQESKPGGGS